MDPISHKTRCPKCSGKLKGRRETLGAVDDTVWACVPCGLYGVEGDDRMLLRADSATDDEFQGRLLRRAVKIKDWEKERKGRFTDCEPGRLK